MRIIAGVRRGLVLHPFDLPFLRPTKDIVKEFMFNCLANWIDISTVTVWDLYSGTGALGLEALSRGARHATFVEKDERGIQLIRRNVEKAKFETVATVCHLSVEEFLQAPHEPVALIIADPPYDMTAGNFLIENLGRRGYLAPDGMLVLECSPREAIDEIPQWKRVKSRAWGDSQVYMWKWTGSQ